MVAKWAVHNFKPIREETEPELSPFTIFAGANRSGKNMFIQSVVLVAQTLAQKVGQIKNEIAQGDSPSWVGVVVSATESGFRELCQEVCTDQGSSVPPKILRSIVETITGQNLPAVHALRTGPGGNNPQRMRGSDKAQRRDIDRELHLHYWECADGTVELASVVYHNDFSIPG